MFVDGHNDLVVHTRQGDEIRDVHLEEAADAGFAGGFFALFIPSPDAAPKPEPGSRSYSAPLPAPIPEDEAMRIGEELYETFRSLPVRLATSPDDFGPERVAAVLHLEGAEPLAPDLSNLDS